MTWLTMVNCIHRPATPGEARPCAKGQGLSTAGGVTHAKGAGVTPLFQGRSLFIPYLRHLAV